MAKEYLVATPGPVPIHKDVRAAMCQPITNPDLDPAFYEFYKETCEKIQLIMKTKNQVLILCGEGILGLEAACASIIEPGDRILCLDNGIFGRGFVDFAKMYGAEVTHLTFNYRNPISVKELELFLEKDSNFKAATFVHCETPSGITNSAEAIGKLLRKFNILSIMDSVSAAGGEDLEVDEWGLDLVLVGSQKCFSAAPGLTFLSISDKAWKSIENRCLPISGFYLNLTIWKNWYEKKSFPYTQPISDIYGLSKAADRIIEDKDFKERHKRISAYVRSSFIANGYKLYPSSGFSNTVTAIEIPQGIDFHKFFNLMLEEGVIIAGSLGELSGKVFRIGHMGESCQKDYIEKVLATIDSVMKKIYDSEGLALGVTFNLADYFKSSAI